MINTAKFKNYSKKILSALLQICLKLDLGSTHYSQPMGSNHVAK